MHYSDWHYAGGIVPIAGVSSMSITSDSPRSYDAASGLEPLRAKSGWIVALGVVYVIAGFVALGSVVFATVVTVFVVGIMMLIAGAAEVVNAFQIKTWGKFLLWLLLGVLYIVAGFVTFENPLFAAGAADSSARIHAGRLGNHADSPGVQHEGGNALALGGVFGRDHSSARPRDFGALAGLRPLHSGALPRHRSHLCRSELDRRRIRTAATGLAVGQNRKFAVRLSHEQDEAAMRWVYLIVIILFVAAIVLFGFQNLELVTMSFLGFSVRAPLAIVAAIVYLLGAITGGSLFALLRRSVQATRTSRPAIS